jgi:hypothetical protein
MHAPIRSGKRNVGDTLKGLFEQGEQPLVPVCPQLGSTVSSRGVAVFVMAGASSSAIDEVEEASMGM